ncbi:Outer dynein arm protein 1 [Symbiodinium microadriaticum]|uniref:Outer dynein arm protein 1 n=1 Tax=Symbiodinium microadriaticum TaxID=2951 RepID=A0A1Q9CHU2_SYMMI|nr:Outer dynein arm protein 1 [Symbiodinium microadriaticum]
MVTIRWRWVKCRSGNIHNERADEQRVEVMRRQRDDERRTFTEKVLEIRKDAGIGKDIKLVELDKRQVEVRLKQAEGRVQRKNERPACKEVLGLGNLVRCDPRQHQKSIEIFEQAAAHRRFIHVLGKIRSAHAFRTIKERTGISNIEEIVKIFVHLESRNFSLLTYVNHMNREIEALEGGSASGVRRCATIFMLIVAAMLSGNEDNDADRHDHQRHHVFLIVSVIITITTLLFMVIVIVVHARPHLPPPPHLVSANIGIIIVVVIIVIVMIIFMMMVIIFVMFVIILLSTRPQPTHHHHCRRRRRHLRYHLLLSSPSPEGVKRGRRQAEMTLKQREASSGLCLLWLRRVFWHVSSLGMVPRAVNITSNRL